MLAVERFEIRQKPLLGRAAQAMRRIEIQDPRLRAAARRSPGTATAASRWSSCPRPAPAGRWDRSARRTPAGSGSPSPGHRSSTSRAPAGRRVMWPVFSALIDWPWLFTPVCIERIRQMSSATSPRCGTSSLSSMPHWPCGENFQGLANSLALASAALSYLMSPVKVCMCRLGQLRLGVEQVDVAGAALHEHRDHGRGLRRRGRGLGQSRRSLRLELWLGRRACAPRPDATARPAPGRSSQKPVDARK